MGSLFDRFSNSVVGRVLGLVTAIPPVPLFVGSLASGLALTIARVWTEAGLIAQALITIGAGGLAYCAVASLREHLTYPLRPGVWPEIKVATLMPDDHTCSARVVGQQAVLTLRPRFQGAAVTAGWDCRVRETAENKWYYLKTTVTSSEEADSVTVKFPRHFAGVHSLRGSIYEVEFIRRRFDQFNRNWRGWETLASCEFSTPIKTRKRTR